LSVLSSVNEIIFLEKKTAHDKGSVDYLFDHVKNLDGLLDIFPN